MLNLFEARFCVMMSNSADDDIQAMSLFDLFLGGINTPNTALPDTLEGGTMKAYRHIC